MGGAIQFNGIVSGLNTSAIIQALLTSYQAPITALQTQQTGVQNEETALQSLNTKMSSLQNAVQALQLQSTVLAKQVTTSGGISGAVTGTATPDAANGSFQVTVNSLATGTIVNSTQAIGNALNLTAPLASAGFALAPTVGTFSINGVNITIDSSTIMSNGTDAPGADTIISKINNAGANVSASIVNDSLGRPNLLQITSTNGQPIQFGSAGDTSNFLTAAKLITAGGSTTAVSTSNLGQTQAMSLLSSANLATPVAASGSFSINGVAISYNAATDTLNDVINRINSSTAGVVASYDPVADKVMLQSQTTGSLAISLKDTSGNFLAATGVLSATQTPGKNASFSISTIAGGATQSSTSNTIGGLIPGVTLTLQQTGTTTVSVGSNPAPLTSALQNFVTSFNAVLDEVNSDTAYNSQTKKAGIFFTDSQIFGINGAMLSNLFAPGVGLTGAIQSLADIGLSTGAIGSTPGTTNDLTLNTSKLAQALQSNPSQVAQLLQGAPGTLTGVMGNLNNYLNNWVAPSGVFHSRLTSDDSQINELSTQIANQQQVLNDRQAALVQQFAQMEATLAQLQQQGAQMSGQMAQMSSNAAAQQAHLSSG